MRINDNHYILYSYQKQQNRSNTTNSSNKTASSLDVNISPRGREISQAIMSEQAQRQQRIQELKQKIADGSYHVDSSKITQKMIDFWKDTDTTK